MKVGSAREVQCRHQSMKQDNLMGKIFGGGDSVTEKNILCSEKLSLQSVSLTCALRLGSGGTEKCEREGK